MVWQGNKEDLLRFVLYTLYNTTNEVATFIRGIFNFAFVHLRDRIHRILFAFESNESKKVLLEADGQAITLVALLLLSDRFRGLAQLHLVVCGTTHYGIIQIRQGPEENSGGLAGSEFH